MTFLHFSRVTTLTARHFTLEPLLVHEICNSIVDNWVSTTFPSIQRKGMPYYSMDFVCDVVYTILTMQIIRATQFVKDDPS